MARKKRLKRNVNRSMQRRLKGNKKPMSEEQKLIRKNIRQAQSEASKKLQEKKKL